MPWSHIFRAVGPTLAWGASAAPLAATSRRNTSWHSRSICVCVVLLSLVQLSVQQKDPVNNFCRRFGHQTAVIDKRLYVDGGLIDWNPIPSYPQNYSSK